MKQREHSWWARLSHLGLLGFIAMSLVSCQQTETVLQSKPSLQAHKPTPPSASTLQPPLGEPIPPSEFDVLSPSIAPDSHKIAVMVPLTGPQKDLGRALLKASTLALYQANDPSIELIPIDTADAQRMAPDRLRHVLSHNFKAVVGPLLSADIPRIRPFIGQTPVLSFSNNTAAAGQGVFISGYQLDDQVDQLITYAKQQHPLRSIAILLPETQHGHILEAMIRRVLAPHGVEIVLVEYYNPRKLSDLRAAEHLRNTPHDAIMIPEGGPTLHSLISTLVERGYNVQSTLILGLDSWRTANLKDIPNLAGALYAALPQDRKPAFETLYRSTYHTTPPALSALGYDLTTLAIVLAIEENAMHQARTHGDTPIPVTMLQRPEGFVGATGLFRFLADGRNQRGLQINRVSRVGVICVQPALTQFPRDNR